MHELTVAFLNKLANNIVEEKNGILPTQILTKNNEVREINNRRFAELSGEQRNYATQDLFFSRDDEIPQEIEFDVQLRERLLQEMNDLAPQISLKIGTQVIVTKNLKKQNLVNGSRGVITGTETFIFLTLRICTKCEKVGTEIL